jgi:hypothetical protein
VETITKSGELSNCGGTFSAAFPIEKVFSSQLLLNSLVSSLELSSSESAFGRFSFLGNFVSSVGTGISFEVGVS